MEPMGSLSHGWLGGEGFIGASGLGPGVGRAVFLVLELYLFWVVFKV